jgi:2-haloacid dehalogenase
MSAQLTAVTFDLGGVLIDWNPRYLYRKLFGDDAAMERFLSEVATNEWNGTIDSGRSFAGAVADLTTEHPEQAEMIRAYHLRWSEMLGPVFEGTLQIVREVKAAGYRTYALSNWSAETFGRTRERFKFLDEMDGILISGEVGIVKPDPAIFREFLRRFDLDPAATVYVDDLEPNVRAAESVGINALLFAGADRLRADLRELGVPLAGAAAV